MAELEARKLRCSTTGTGFPLMGILIEGTSLAAKFLLANGIILSYVKNVSSYWDRVTDLYSVLMYPLTEDAQRPLDWAVNQKLKFGDDGEITTIDLLLGIWLGGITWS